MRYPFLFIVILFCSVACSTQSLYEGLREGARQQCRATPDTTASDACAERVNRQRYEDYEKERRGDKLR